MRPASLIPILAIVLVLSAITGCDRRPRKVTVPDYPSVANPAEPAPFTDGIGIEFVPIPKGSALVGTNEPAGPSSPAHTVQAGPFYLSSTEVTVAQWERYFNYNTAHGWGMWDAVARYCPADDCPIIAISYLDAVEFCKFMTRHEGVSYRLPTEFEWEYAATAGGRAEFTDDLFYARTEPYPFTHPVKLLPPTGLGLYGTRSNALEWTSSEFLPYPGAQQMHPLYDFKAIVLRGGRLQVPTPEWTREASKDTIRNFNYGFRVLREW